MFGVFSAASKVLTGMSFLGRSCRSEIDLPQSELPTPRLR